MKAQRGLTLAFADYIAAARWAHSGGMYGSCGDIGPIAGATDLGAAIDRQAHLSAQNDVRGFGLVSVV